MLDYWSVHYRHWNLKLDGIFSKSNIIQVQICSTFYIFIQWCFIPHILGYFHWWPLWPRYILQLQELGSLCFDIWTIIVWGNIFLQHPFSEKFLAFLVENSENPEVATNFSVTSHLSYGLQSMMWSGGFEKIWLYDFSGFAGVWRFFCRNLTLFIV